MKKEAIRNAKTFDELLDIKYGKVGSSQKNCIQNTMFYRHQPGKNFTGVYGCLFFPLYVDIQHCNGDDDATNSNGNNITA